MSDYVSEDSFLLIFKHLPVKTLLRFRCVSKWWKGLIDTHEFMQHHLALQNPLFIGDLHEVPNEFLVLDPLTLPSLKTLTAPIRDDEPEKRLRLLGTHHGVVCLSDNETEYLLWNPTIRKFTSIPLPEFIGVELFEGNEVVYRLPNFFEWDVNEIATFSAFWIDPASKHFKIITFRSLRVNENCDIPLHGIFYSSSVDPEWVFLQKMDPIFFNCRPMIGAPPVMVGDVAYWNACILKVDEDEDEDEPVEHSKAGILWFDFVQERFGYIRVPNKDYSGDYQPVHCKLQGKLSLVYWDSEAPFRCDIYAWKEEDTWVKMFDFGLYSPTMFKVFCVLDEMKDRCRALAIDGKELVLYDDKEGSIALRSIESPIMCFVYDFVESLLFP